MKGVMDYFVADHRSDLRMVLTEETQWSFTTATGEENRQTLENSRFIFPNGTRVPKSEAPGWQSNASGHITKVNEQNKIGTNRLLKVMAGDLITANTKYYYQAAVANANTPSPVATVLSMLVGSITGSTFTSASTKSLSGDVQNGLNNTQSFTDLLNGYTTNNAGDKPKAFLNVLFFDERFNFVSEGSVQGRVIQHGDNAPQIVLSNIKVPRNGYCYVYVSNESPSSVYFDDLKVRHDNGRILEETHYYAYGLKIAPLSSRASGAIKNNYLYQGAYAEFDDEIGWNNFMLRSYDPELGRFMQQDPYDQFANSYSGMGCDPANNVDPTGGIVPGLGCPSVAGMSGFGGMISRLGSGMNFGLVISTVASIGGYASKGLILINNILSDPDPPTKSRPSAASKKWTDDKLKDIFRPRPKPSANPLILLINFLLLPSDANSRIDDTIDGIGGWKQAEREEKAREQQEDDYENRNPDKDIRYVTYRKFRLEDDGSFTVYSGRTSGPASMSKEDIVKLRDRQHETRNQWLKGYGEAIPDKEAVASKLNPQGKYAIRGREQQLIDYHGRARSNPDNGTSGNRIRGVGRYNIMRRIYHNASNARWGQLHEFTGFIP